MCAAGLEVGDRVDAHAEGPGRVVLEPEEDLLANFAGVLTGGLGPNELRTCGKNRTDAARRRSVDRLLGLRRCPPSKRRDVPSPRPWLGRPWRETKQDVRFEAQVARYRRPPEPNSWRHHPPRSGPARRQMSTLDNTARTRDRRPTPSPHETDALHGIGGIKRHLPITNKGGSMTPAKNLPPVITDATPNGLALAAGGRWGGMVGFTRLVGTRGRVRRGGRRGRCRRRCRWPVPAGLGHRA